MRQVLFKSIFLSLLLAMFAWTDANAQKVRYVFTKRIDSEGNTHQPSAAWAPMVIYINFNGNVVTEQQNWGTLMFKYRYNDGGNSVYCMVARDAVNGRETWVENSMYVFSSDKRTLNKVSYFDGQRQWTLVYKRQDQPETGGFYN